MEKPIYGLVLIAVIVSENIHIFNSVNIQISSYPQIFCLNNFCISLHTVPSGFPENITTIATDSRTLAIMWTPPPEDLQNGIIVDYTVNITVTETGESFQHTTDGNTTLLLTGLHPYYTYSITVAASTSIGLGPYTVMYFIRMPEDGM